MLTTPPRRATSSRARQAFEPVKKRPSGLHRLDGSPINETQPKVSPGVKRGIDKSASQKVVRGQSKHMSPPADEQFLVPGEACPRVATGTVFHT